ncbi:hypothetical protein [Parasedimentitalea huanghaiensis]|uniref:Uncharacterized protein n=1 Tax=Parasedimentitalea huanghaiensis TaxID=2682100 RepID=A0A6L6WJ64_9RHOB|nr:hypothetical protein [Zongyanglinia huanghaiensis]MVO17391.1 hypothetical protein [Zongyanglinia huanghaiensis]
MNYTYTSLICVLFMAGCSIFAPPYKKEADTLISKAYENVTKITACVDLGLCAQPNSFSNKEENYTQAISSLKSSYLIIASWEPSSSNSPAMEANQLLLEMIKGCETAVINLSNLHRSSGLISGAGVAQPVDIQCDQAVRAVRAMK